VSQPADDGRIFQDIFAQIRNYGFNAHAGSATRITKNIVCRYFFRIRISLNSSRSQNKKGSTHGRRIYRRRRRTQSDDVSPLMPEELAKVIREMPRDPEVIEMLKKFSGVDPLPSR
jgi:hypothetical protein